MTRLGRAIWLGALVVAVAARPAPAQRVAVRLAPIPPPGPTAPGPAPSRPLARATAADLPAWVFPAASLIVPGTGQFLAGKPRGLVYLAVEAWVIGRALAADGLGDRERQLYQDLAFEVARRPFTDVRVEGPFEYYETMAAWPESGEYDLDAGPDLAPETREDTYNGALWRLARTTFFVDPDSAPPPDSPAYRAALGFYAERAVRDPFRWSWRNARLEQDVFRRTIRRSDDAYQEMTNWLGALVLNHVASAVDALVSTRAGRPVSVAPRLVAPAGGRDLRIGWRTPF